jgi:uroporphyrinogen decarboxylase
VGFSSDNTESNTLSKRDAVFKVLGFEEVKPVPYTVWYDPDTEKRLTEHYGSANWKLRINNFIDRYTLVWEPEINIDQDHYRDLHGTIWHRGHPVYITKPAMDTASMKGFEIPSYVPYLDQDKSDVIDTTHSVVRTFRFKQLEEHLREHRPDAFTIVGYGPGILERGWMIRDFEQFYMDLILHPDFVQDLLDLVLERQLELLEAICQMPIDAILFIDDWGDQQGVTIGPDLWRTFIKPRTKRLYDRVHQHGKKAFQHTCGNVFPLIPDLIEIGLDCLQSVQPEAMPVYELKRNYGKQLALWGGLGTQQLLPRGTPEQIRTEAKKLKQKLGAGGGYIFTSCKPIMSDVPLANAIALIEETISG